MNVQELQAGLARCRVAKQVIAAIDAGREPADDESPASVQASRHGLVKLDAGVPTDGSQQWQQVAVTGNYLGYQGGSAPFTFDDAVFANIISNFHASPQYRPDGSGLVVPWDVAHLSEQPGQSIDAYQAVGWIGELQTRGGPGGLELWALTTWTPSMAQAIKSGAFAFASVVVDFASIDPLTGQDVGATLRSVATTNQPFLPALQRLVASRAHVHQHSGVTPMLSIRLPPGIAPGSALAQQLGNAALKLAMQHRQGTADTTSNQNNPIPDWKAPLGLNDTLWAEVMTKARAAGINGASYTTALAWLRAQGADVVKELGLDDAGREPIVVGHLLLDLAGESHPVGTDQSPVHPISPAGLSRAAPWRSVTYERQSQRVPARLSDGPVRTVEASRGVVDARSHEGRNSVERAIAALSASPVFSALDWAQKVEQAGEAIRSGRVLA